MFVALPARAVLRTPELALGLLFVSGALLKARFLPQFAHSIRGYRLVTAEPSVWAVAIAVTAGEGLVGTGLLMPWAVPLAAKGALALLAIFTAAVVAAILRLRRRAELRLHGARAGFRYRLERLRSQPGLNCLDRAKRDAGTANWFIPLRRGAAFAVARLDQGSRSIAGATRG
jgi:hypothetical protein